MESLFLTPEQRVSLYSSLRSIGVNVDKYDDMSSLDAKLNTYMNSGTVLPVSIRSLEFDPFNIGGMGGTLCMTVPTYVIDVLKRSKTGIPINIMLCSGYSGIFGNYATGLLKTLEDGSLVISISFRYIATGAARYPVTDYAVYATPTSSPNLTNLTFGFSYTNVGQNLRGYLVLPEGVIFPAMSEVTVGYYSSLEDVFQDLNNNNATNILSEPSAIKYDKYEGTHRVTLLDDVTLDTQIVTNTDFIFNLNGHTLTFDGEGGFYGVKDRTITICDGRIVDNDYWVYPEGSVSEFIGTGEYTLIQRFRFDNHRHVTLCNLRIECDVRSTEVLRQRHIFLRVENTPITLRNLDTDVKFSNTLGETYADLYNAYFPLAEQKQYRSFYLFYLVGSPPETTLQEYPDSYWKNCVVENVRVDMNGSYSAQMYGLYVYGYNAIIRNCRLQVRNSCVYATYSTTDSYANPLFSPGTLYQIAYGNLFMEHVYVNAHRAGRAYSTTLTNSTLTGQRQQYVYNCYIHGVRDGLSMGTCPFVVGCGDITWRQKRTRIVKGGFVSSAGHGGAYTTSTSGLVHWLDKTLYPDHPCGYTIDYGHDQGGTTAYGWDDEFTQFLFQDCKIGWRLKPTGPSEPTYSGAQGTYLGYCSKNYSDNVRWHIDFQPGYDVHSPIVMNSRGAIVWGDLNKGYILPNGWASGSLASTNYDYDPRKLIPLKDWQGYMMRDLKPIVLRQTFNVNTTSWTLGGPCKVGSTTYITGACAPYIKEGRPVMMYVYLQNPGAEPVKLYEKAIHFGNKDVPALSEGITFTDPTLQIKSGGYVWIVFVPSKSTDVKADSTVYYLPHFSTNVNGVVTDYLGWSTPVAVSFSGKVATSFSYYWYDLMNNKLNAFPAPKRVQFSASNSYFRPSSILRHDGGDMYVGSGNYAGGVPVTADNKSVFSTSTRVHYTGGNYRLPYEEPVFYTED